MFQHISETAAVVRPTLVGAGSALASEEGAAPPAVRMQRVDPHLSSHKASCEWISASVSLLLLSLRIPIGKLLALV
jgi:hypothetical protein